MNYQTLAIFTLVIGIGTAQAIAVISSSQAEDTAPQVLTQCTPTPDQTPKKDSSDSQG